MFFLHHAGLDRVWWKWQNVNLSTRLYGMGGRINGSIPEGEVTLDYRLPFAGFSPDVSIRSAMDIRREPYCYTYAN